MSVKPSTARDDVIGAWRGNGIVVLEFHHLTHYRAPEHFSTVVGGNVLDGQLRVFDEKKRLTCWN
ncbi:hypothetical protein [Mycobacterium uberis]|uniref:hypothetical protein n=1 Tax=Mycobacterium uberis TaxID=2162698 RepID=UPI0010585E0F|nr:hypothetical protein [Mycobacterium uberis]